MQRILLSARILFGLAMVVGMLMIGSATPASASHGARITIHAAVCDSNVSDIYGTCHDNRLGGVPFNVAGVWRETTTCMSPRTCSDGGGVVSWTPGAGTRTIIQDARVFDRYEGAYVYCSNQVTGAVLFDGPITTNRVTITTTAGQEVICDWYNLT
ncbi:MAG: hypothetical protein ACRDJH_14950 [Thermomicrobiales bacterium]